jgi:hypothetical protein
MAAAVISFAPALIPFQRCSDMLQIEKFAHSAVTVCEKMGYTEGMARGLQVTEISFCFCYHYSQQPPLQAYAQCRLHQGNVEVSRKLLEQCVLLQRRCNNPVGESVAIATAAASLEPSIDAKPMLEKALSIAKDCHAINNCVAYLIRLGNLFA